MPLQDMLDISRRLKETRPELRAGSHDWWVAFRSEVDKEKTVPDVIIFYDEKMTFKEREELTDSIRNLVHNEFWDQFSCTVIGPTTLKKGGK